MKLKTLKGLVIRNPYGKYNEYVQIEELKQEAIEWLKYYESGKAGNYIPIDITSFIRHFFNITKEDLKWE